MNKQQTLQIQLQILKAYTLQKHPLIALTVKNENLYFGSCIDPVTRVAEAHKINLFPKAPIFFLHRQSQQIEQGLIQLLFTSFFTLQFVNRVFFGAPGLINYMCGLQTLLGIRQLAFAAYEFQSQQQKLGFSDRNQYIKAIGQAESYNFHGKNVNEINQFILKNSKDPFIPMKLMRDNAVQSENYFKIIPICSENAVQYLILFKNFVEINKEWLKRNGIPLGRIEELKSGKYKKNGQILQVSDKEIYSNDFSNMYTAILILNFENEQEIQDFDQNKLSQCIQQYENEFKQYTLDDEQQMIVIHDSNLQLLKSDFYKEFVQTISKLLKTFHIIVAQDIDNNNDQQNQYYHLEYLKCLSESLPKLFQYRKQQYQEFNIQQIWPQLDIQPLKKVHQIMINKDQIQFDSIQQLIHFYPKQQMIQLIQKLYQQQEQQFNNFDYYFTPLGTSSSTMNQSRSVSCWHFEFKNGISLLLDCGMGTLDQLYFNSINDTDFQEKLTKIKIIYISHFHNDHHQGLINLLTKKFQYSDEEIYIILPYNILLYYHYEIDKLPFKNKIKIIFPSYLFVNQQKTLISTNPVLQQYIDKMQSEFELNFHQFTQLLFANDISIKLQFSHHCEASTYIKLNHKNNSIVYSSDRKGKMDHKTTSFVMFSESCDIMIHECTYPDDMQDRAEEVSHSTFCQAIQTAIQSKVKYLILTHFTEKSLFYLKSLIDDRGYFIKEKIDNIFKKSGYDLNRLNEFMQKQVIIANDFQIMSDRNLNSLPQISRMIMKMLHP